MYIISADAYLQEQPQKGERFTGRFPSQDPQELTLYRLAKAYVGGKNPLISPLYNKGVFTNFLGESTPYSDNLISVCHQQNGPFVFEPKEYYEDCAFLCHHWANGFYHWMLEALPHLFLFESIGFNGKYIVPRGDPFIKESLALLGISADRLIEYTAPFVAKNLYVGERFPHFRLHRFTGAIDQLRNTFLERIDQPKIDAPTRLYISRRHRRNIVNEEQLLEYLDPYGFQTIHMEDLSLTKQIAVAARADTLLGPHGAGFVCSLFMLPYSTVVEFFSHAYVNPCVLHIAQHLGHKYIPVPEYLNNGRPGADAVGITAHPAFVTTLLQGHLSK